MSENVHIARLKVVKDMTNDPASKQLADIMISYIVSQKKAIGFQAQQGGGDE